MSTALVLMYHAISKHGVFDETQLDRADQRYLLSEIVFRNQLTSLLSSGWESCSLESGSPLERRDTSVYDASRCKRLLCSFDDSWASHLHVSLPVLQELNITGIFFLTVNQIGRKKMLTSPEVRVLRDAGGIIGSHGMTHRHFDTLSPDVLRGELTDSRNALSDLAGHEIDCLALPGGRSHKLLLDLAREAGYRHIFTSRPGIWRSGDYLIPRLAVTAKLQGATLNRLLAEPVNFCRRSEVRFWFLYLLKSVLGPEKYCSVRRSLLKE